MTPPRTLADLIAPTRVSRFLTDFHGREHGLFRGGAGRFDPVLPWPALNELLERNRLVPPRLRLVRGGTDVDPAAYVDEVPLRDGGHARRLLTGALLGQLREGATLVIDAVEELHGQVGALAAALERDLREHVQVNLYAGWGTSHGFDVHWDNHDVLALQVAGRKQWRLYGTTRPFPLSRDVEPPPPPEGDPVAEYLLEEGDVLYLPRGHWHDVAALGTPSLHLTFGFAPATGIDLAEWLVDRLRADERFRRDLPRFAAPERRKELAETLYAAIGEYFDAEAVDRFLLEHDANARLSPGICLPWSAAPEGLPPGADAVARLLTTRAAVRRRPDGTVVLFAAGHQWVFAGAAEPVLTALADGTEWTLGALGALPGSSLDAATVRALLAELTSAGLVVVKENPS
jgi:cupin superfamily protein/ribosomal oxygenase RoxA-like protein